MKTLLINLVGASGSGKDTVSKELTKKGYNDIKSYTTREPREDNEWGHTFIGKGNVLIDAVSGVSVGVRTEEGKFYSFDEMIAYFNSYKSKNQYFATDNQVMRGRVNLYRVDPKGAKMVKEYYKNNNNIRVVTVFLKASEPVRAERIAKRSNLEDRKVFNYKDIPEVWNRVGQDRELFKAVECDYVVNADLKIEEVARLLELIINKEKENVLC